MGNTSCLGPIAAFSRQHRATFRLVLLAAFAMVAPAAAPTSYTLLHSLFNPGTNGQATVGQGHSVAVDGNIAIAGAPYSDLGSGAVQIYDVRSGALLHSLRNPSPAAGDQFGNSVAISGTRVVVGAHWDDAGAQDVGIAYVYDLASATPVLRVATLHNPGSPPNNDFGFSVAISGTRVAVGAPFDDTGATNAGSAYVYDLSGVMPSVPVIVLTNPAPAGGDVFGYSVSISGALLVIGAYGDDSGATNAGSVYVYDLASATPRVPVATLNNPSPAAYDLFGNSVAISGTRVVVGAYFDDMGATNVGSAYVYDLASATPVLPVATLNNPRPGPFGFGFSVAISSTRVVVGASGDDTGANAAGAAYVYDLSSATPRVPVATLTNPTPAASDFFGASVAVAGTRVVVAADGDDTVATNAGSAYAYDLAGPTPTVPVATLNKSSLVGFDYFSYSLALSDTRVVVGAYLDDTGATNAGRAYVYDLSSATPRVPVATLTNPTPAVDDFFGQSVAIAGTRVVVGAWGDNTRATNAGSAYVYDLASATPRVPVATLTNPTPVVGDRFGFSVNISGGRVVVGADCDDTGAEDAGSVYVYNLTSPTPTVPVIILTNPSPVTYDHFGVSVAISDWRVVVGTPYDNTGASDAGSAYVYNLTSPTPTVPAATLTNPSPAAGDQFGNSVAISGTRVVVGAYVDDMRATNAGSAYVFDLASATPSVPVATLTNPSPADLDLFGYSLAISGTRIVVGAYGDDTGVEGAGSAYVYDLASATPALPVATLNNPTPGPDTFGISVSVDDTTVVVAAPFDDNFAPDHGVAYVFGVGPTLRIVPTAPGSARISWTPAISPGFVLQYTESFAPPDWRYASSAETSPVGISTTNTWRFYRLRRQ